jgi:hypothetical protein
VADFILGLDLGQAGDFTALATLKRSIAINDEGLPVRDRAGRLVYQTAVVGLNRYELGTPYTAIVSNVAETMKRPEIRPRPRLVIDATGVGRPVVDLFVNEMRGCLDIYPLTITAGAETRKGAWGAGIRAYWTPKKELAGTVQAGLGTGRLKIAAKLRLADLLRKELLDFKVKVTAAANETFSAREGTHDDLVLSVAMACWLARRKEIPYITTAESDPGRQALALEQEERDALMAEKRAEAERQAERQRRRDREHVWNDPAAWINL